MSAAVGPLLQLQLVTPVWWEWARAQCYWLPCDNLTPPPAVPAETPTAPPYRKDDQDNISLMSKTSASSYIYYIVIFPRWCLWWWNKKLHEGFYSPACPDKSAFIGHVLLGIRQCVEVSWRELLNTQALVAGFFFRVQGHIEAPFLSCSPWTKAWLVPDCLLSWLVSEHEAAGTANAGKGNAALFLMNNSSWQSTILVCGHFGGIFIARYLVHVGSIWFSRLHHRPDQWSDSAV